MKKCPKCSFENIDSAKHCINCGTRMDGNLTCPKCHEVISVDTLKCPNCGEKIPHKEEEVLSKKGQEYKTLKQKLDPVFQRIFIIVSIVAFFVSIGLLIPDVFTITKNGEVFHYNSVTIIAGYFDGDTNLDVVSRSILVGLIELNALITIAFSVIGIVKSFKAFRSSPRKFNAYRELGVVLASNAVVGLTIPTYITTDANFVYNSVCLVSTVSMLTGIIMFMMVFHTYQSFSKTRPLIFAEKVIFSFVLYFALLVIFSIGLPQFSYLVGENNIASVGSVDFLIRLSRAMPSITGSLRSDYLTILVLQYISVFIQVVIAISLSSIIVYFMTLYFSRLERYKAPKVPLYFVGLFVGILSIINLGISIFVIYRYAYLEGLNNVVPISSIAIFIMTLLLFAFILTSLNITRKILRQDKLIKKQEELSSSKVVE